MFKVGDLVRHKERVGTVKTFYSTYVGNRRNFYYLIYFEGDKESYIISEKYLTPVEEEFY